ncbi:MAG: type VI secretion system tip protein VgrG [Gammaproteobacteria bacterium]|nr:type VI secretion system tip protein VgrG [Gammaproteobacteria bacterium]
MTATEQLGRLFEYKLEMLSEDHNIKVADILGQNVTVRLDLPDDEKRYFNGFVRRFSQVGVAGRHARYYAEVVPWLWFLTRTSDCRIFQEKTVPDIIEEVFSDLGYTDFEDKLSGSYRTWENCVQYRETDFNFVSRLMEQEGIYYFFKHEDGKHTLEISDSYSAHERIPGYEQIPFHQPDESQMREEEHIFDWQISHVVQPKTFAHDDYDFKRPKSDLTSKSSITKDHAKADYEIYDYPGEYVEVSDGDNYARARIEELHVQHELLEGQGNARGISVGGLFELTDCPRDDQNREYLVTAATHELTSGEYESGETESGPTYSCSFKVIDAQQPFRAARTTPKPVVQGPQTAIIVGPSGKESWTDKYGRVKAQFHWDRYGKEDENSSCWMRVSQPWAGKGWGGMFLPHIGQEVIVSFLEGDPDQPIITGRVYNNDNMPQEGLPGNEMKSVWSDRCGNEFIMDSKEGAEKIELRDKYGNELVMDAVAGTIRLYSPTHETEMVAGKSFQWKTVSDWINNVGGLKEESIVGTADIRVGGDVTEAFLGAEAKATVGWRSRLVGGWKQEVIVGAETKSINGAKSETIRGAVFKKHVGREYKIDDSKYGVKTPNAAWLFGKGIFDYGEAKSKIRKENKETAESHYKCTGKRVDEAINLVTKAQTAKQSYEAELELSAAEEAHRVSGKMKNKASSWLFSGTDMKCKSSCKFG